MRLDFIHSLNSNEKSERFNRLTFASTSREFLAAAIGVGMWIFLRTGFPMVIKVIGFVVFLLGVATAAFAIFAYLELNSAARSAVTPKADSMPFTRFVGPELFDSEVTNAKPAELAVTAFNRIYLIGAGSVTVIIAGLILLVAGRGQRTVDIQRESR